jgi:hypothetical protein
MKRVGVKSALTQTPLAKKGSNGLFARQLFWVGQGPDTQNQVTE